MEQSNSQYELQGEYVLPGSRTGKENGNLLRRAMAGHLGSVISSMGRWRMRLEVPRAEIAEMLPLARLVSRSTNPALQFRSKVRFDCFNVHHTLWHDGDGITLQYSHL